MNGNAQVEQLQAQLQDAHLVIGEQQVALRRYAIIVDQLQQQIARQEQEPVLEEEA